MAASIQIINYFVFSMRVTKALICFGLPQNANYHSNVPMTDNDAVASSLI
jgi:hypothetical protein